MNPGILVAVIIQFLISRASRMTGAIAGYLITTGIFIWGMSVYSDGDAVAILRIPLSQFVFIFACLIWYGFDTSELIKARKIEEENRSDGVRKSVNEKRSHSVH